MRTEHNLQVINAISQKNFNPKLLEKYSGFGGMRKELVELIITKNLMPLFLNKR